MVASAGCDRRRAGLHWPTPRGCGGIGRRARFRSVCPSGRGGSSPLIRTLTKHPHPHCGGAGRRVPLRRSPGGEAGPDDRGRRDAERRRRSAPRAAHGAPRPEARGVAGEGRAQPAARRSPRRRSAGATASSRTASPSSCRRTRCRCSRRCRGSRGRGRTPTTPSATRPARAGTAAITQGPEVIGADKLWGAGARDGGQRDEDRDHRRRPRRDAQVLRPDRAVVPARLPEGPDAVHDAEGDRPADVRAGLAGLQVRQRALRPDTSRSTRRTSAGSRPATTTRWPATSGSPASRRTRTSATTRRSRSRRRTSGSTATRPRSPPRSSRPSPTG